MFESKLWHNKNRKQIVKAWKDGGRISQKLQPKASQVSGVMDNFIMSLGSNNKNLVEIFAWAISKNKQIQYFGSRMYLSVILTP